MKLRLEVEPIEIDGERNCVRATVACFCDPPRTLAVTVADVNEDDLPPLFMSMIKAHRDQAGCDCAASEIDIDGDPHMVLADGTTLSSLVARMKEDRQCQC